MTLSLWQAKAYQPEVMAQMWQANAVITERIYVRVHIDHHDKQGASTLRVTKRASCVDGGVWCEANGIHGRSTDRSD